MIAPGEVHISVHIGKLKGLRSISTYPYCYDINTNRKGRPNEGLVCYHCYAHRYLQFRKKLKACLLHNSEVLGKALKPVQIPLTSNDRFFRFESFGDVRGTVYLDNYCKIAEANPWTTFALWSKRYKLCDGYFDKHKKPKNLILIYSSAYVGVELRYHGRHNDKVFTVFPKDYVGPEINCGNKCIDCLLCYTKNKVRYIGEHLK